MENEVDAMLKSYGLANKMSYFRDSANKESGSTPLVEIEETSPAALSESLKGFFGLVLGSESSLPEFEQMQVPKLRAEACMLVAKALAEIYDLAYEAIMDPKNGYLDPKLLARHPPDQIRTILGI